MLHLSSTNINDTYRSLTTLVGLVLSLRISRRYEKHNFCGGGVHQRRSCNPEHCPRSPGCGCCWSRPYAYECEPAFLPLILINLPTRRLPTSRPASFNGAKIYAVTTFLGLHDQRFHDLHQELNEAFYDVLDGLLSSSGTGIADSMPRQKLRMITALIDGALLHGTGDIQVDDQFFEDIAQTVLTITQC